MLPMLVANGTCRGQGDTRQDSVAPGWRAPSELSAELTAAPDSAISQLRTQIIPSAPPYAWTSPDKQVPPLMSNSITALNCSKLQGLCRPDSMEKEMWSAGKKGCGQQGKRDMVSRSLWKQAPGLVVQLPGKGRPQGGALGGEDGDGAGRISASHPGQGQPTSFCLLMSSSHLSSLSRTGQGAAALSRLFPVLSSPGCALVRESSPCSVSCPSSEKELH